MKQLSLFGEIIVDNFAGGGGASTGIELATGRSVDIAINHDPAAIAMHRANHPETEHYCENVWEVDPRHACGDRKVALAWFSPDCKHFSKAKGGKPVEKSIRGLAWVAIRWAKMVRPRVIMLENVEEFQTWGPLMTDNKPDPRYKGRTFHHFVHALERYGYKVQWRELVASDYGAPTSRKRFFLIARCDGRPIVWPEPTHGDPNSLGVQSGRLKPWRTAAEIIDWGVECKSIFERKKPLCENTMRRIARGLKKFVVDNPQPYIVGAGGPTYMGKPAPTNKPLGTVITQNHRCLVTPYLIQYHSETAKHEVRGQSMKIPLMTADSSNRYGLVTAWMMHYYGQSVGSPADAPLGTITARGQHIAQVEAFLIKYYGQGDAQDILEPLHTITTKDRFGLVEVKGKPYQIVDIGMRMLTPRELFRAQGFPDSYIIDHDADGKAYPRSAQVARCGNAVPPPFAEALTRANLPDLCITTGTNVKEA